MQAVRWTQGQLGWLQSTVNVLAGGVLWTPKVPPQDLTGRHAIVTGGNSGIGFETALSLARQGASVTLVGRSEEKAQKAVQSIKYKTDNQRIDFALVDFSSLASVRDFTEAWGRREQPRIDILINNAGDVNNRKLTTSENFELTYVTNFLSHFVLTLSLLPYFAPTGRIANVSSNMAYLSDALRPGNGDSADLLHSLGEGDAPIFYVPIITYARTKAAQIVFTQELQRRCRRDERYRGLSINVLHPGFVQTDIWTRTTSLPDATRHHQVRLINLVGITPAAGALTPVYLATSSDQKVVEGGEYWDRCYHRWVPGWMHNEGLASQLWESWSKDAGLLLSSSLPTA